MAVAVLGGGVWSVRSMLGADHGHQHTGSEAAAVDPSGGVASPQDRLAAAPLPQANLQDAQPGPLSTGSTGTITIPQPRTLGAGQVQTGFPHTARGALAQLIAIDQRALQSGSVVTAQDVIAGWAAPGGPTSRTWSGVRAVAALLSAAGLPGDGSADLAIRLQPAMG
ncbi:MAG: hypothetical protein ACRDPB_04760, partial [Nocardioidaceae bacterium]